MACTLPNIYPLVIPTKKLTEYALDKEKEPGKAYGFKKFLGYSPNNYKALAKNIAQNVYNFPAKKRGKNKWGEQYSVTLELIGANGKKAMVVTGWIVDEHVKEVRLVTLYVSTKWR